MINNKAIYVINGVGTSGKDEFINRVGKKILNVVRISYVDRVKDMARNMGWDGVKDDRGRLFLAMLADIWTEYNDGLMKNVRKRIDEYKSHRKLHVYFVMIRKPEVIKRFKTYYPDARTILVTRDGIKVPNNEADKSVLNYKYDITINNSGSLKDLDKQVNMFIKDELKIYKRANI